MCRSKGTPQASASWPGLFTIIAMGLEQTFLMYLPAFNLSRPFIFQAVVPGLPEVGI